MLMKQLTGGTVGVGKIEPLVLSVRGYVNTSLQTHFNQVVLNNYKKIKTLTTQEAQQYLNDSYVSITDTTVTYSVDNTTTVSLTTTPTDISSLNYDPTKEGSMSISVGSLGWRSFCVMLYND